MTIVLLLIVHALVGVVLLGAVTHQAVSLMRHAPTRTDSFLERYSRVTQGAFTRAVVCLYVTNTVLGAMLYPSYRLDVRIPFEEMGLAWAVGFFELKEHFAGIGLGVLPMYAYTWRSATSEASSRARASLTWVLACIVWWDFLVGHMLNNIRGLG